MGCDSDLYLAKGMNVKYIFQANGQSEGSVDPTDCRYHAIMSVLS